MAIRDVASPGEGADEATMARPQLIDVTESAPPEAEAAPKAVDTKKKRGRSKTTTPTARGEFVRQNGRLLGAILLFVVGIVFVILGWYGAANTNILTEQIPYLISGGLLGVALIITAGFLASSASLEKENRALRSDLSRAVGSMGSGAPFGSASLAPAGDGKVLVVAGGKSFHEPGCPIVEGKDASAMSLRKAIDSGYATCKLCGSD